MPPEQPLTQEELRTIKTAIQRHLPEAANRHIDRCSKSGSRAMIGTPMLIVKSHDRRMRPLTANIGARDGSSVEIYVQYDDGRRHREVWVDGKGEIVSVDAMRTPETMRQRLALGFNPLWGDGSPESPDG